MHEFEYIFNTFNCMTSFSRIPVLLSVQEFWNPFIFYYLCAWTQTNPITMLTTAWLHSLVYLFYFPYICTWILIPVYVFTTHVHELKHTLLYWSQLHDFTHSYTRFIFSTYAHELWCITWVQHLIVVYSFTTCGHKCNSRLYNYVWHLFFLYRFKHHCIFCIHSKHRFFVMFITCVLIWDTHLIFTHFESCRYKYTFPRQSAFLLEKYGNAQKTTIDLQINLILKDENIFIWRCFFCLIEKDYKTHVEMLTVNIPKIVMLMLFFCFFWFLRKNAFGHVNGIVFGTLMNKIK